MANGLAWTESGGEVLTLEATMTPGKGLVLTGQLGDVMKESGHAALTWARGRHWPWPCADTSARLGTAARGQGKAGNTGRIRACACWRRSRRRDDR